MNTTRKIAPAALLIALVGASIPASAHHSYAMFDMAQTVPLKGAVSRFKWQNPHAFIEVDVAVGGKNEHWVIEMTSPNNLIQEGWKRSSLKSGDQVTIFVHPLRNGAKGGSYVGVRLASGATLGTVK